MGLELQISQQFSKDIIDLLSATVYGTSGKTRFQHTGVDKKIQKLPNPYFITLKKENRLLGVANYNLKNKILPPLAINQFYIRYFSFLESMRINKPGKKKATSRNKIKDDILSFMEKGSFEEEFHKAIYFAFIEMENERSKMMVNSLGFVPIRELSTSLFSRFFPKIDEKVKEITPEQKPFIKKRLEEFYKGYTFYDPAYLFENGNYYVLMDGDEIVAGIQATKTTWIVKELPGWDGKILFHLLPYIPLVSRVFNPRDYSFASLEYLFVKSGYEKFLNVLLESVCAFQHLNNAMIWADNKSPLYNTLRKNVKFGILDKLHKTVPGQIVVKYTGLERSEKNFFENTPAYISAFDLT